MKFDQLSFDFVFIHFFSFVSSASALAQLAATISKLYPTLSLDGNAICVFVQIIVCSPRLKFLPISARSKGIEFHRDSVFTCSDEQTTNTNYNCKKVIQIN